jgi:predicted ABC-type ATPase
VRQGGHDVAEEKIAKRYDRSLGLLPEAISHCSRAYLFDNSGVALRLIAEFEDAKLIQVSEDLPAWFVNRVLPEFRPEGRAQG